MEPISIDDFKKVEIRVGEILLAERIEGSDKLLKLRVDFGEFSVEGSEEFDREIRQVLSGIAKYFPDPQQLVGKRCAFVVNLPVRTMMGLESQAMILAVGGDLPDGKAGGETPFALFETTGEPGSRAR